MTITINDAQLDTILAALRLYQSHSGLTAMPDEIRELATNGGSRSGLTLAAIDSLCEQINT
ncbi:hypothetical protein [Methylobacterium sp. P5_C11]